MTTLFTQLSNDLEQIITGVEMRRRARHNWMERLMFEEGNSLNNVEPVAPSDKPSLGKNQGLPSTNMKQQDASAPGIDKQH